MVLGLDEVKIVGIRLYEQPREDADHLNSAWASTLPVSPYGSRFQLQE